MTGCLAPDEPLKVEVPVLVHRDVPGDLIVTCPRIPPRPAKFASDKEAYAWALRWGYAGDACRVLSDKQGGWISSP